MEATEVLTGLKARELLEGVGFSLDRETDKFLMKRGAMRVTLPKGNAALGSTQENIVRGIVRTIRERQEKQGDYKKPAMPATVVYRSVVYAVVSDRITKWQLQSLDTGARFEVDKTACEEYDIPLTDFAVQLEEAKVPEPEPAAPAAPVPVTPLTNQSDLAALIRLTTRRQEALKVEFQQLRNRADKLRVQYAATGAFLESLGVEVEELGGLGEIDVAPPRRTILPPSDAPKKRGSSSSHGGQRTGTDYTEHRRVLKEAFIRSGRNKDYGYAGKLNKELEKAGLSIPPSNYIYKLIKDIEEELDG